MALFTRIGDKTTVTMDLLEWQHLQLDLDGANKAVVDYRARWEKVSILLHAAMSWVRSDTESPSAAAIQADYDNLNQPMPWEK